MTPRASFLLLKLPCLLLLALLPFIAEAQGRRGNRGGGRGGFSPGADGAFGGGRNGRYQPDDPPVWEIDPAFKEDVFTFLRLQYPSGGGGYGYGRGGGGNWATDVPDADTHLTLRLHQLTSLKVRPGNPADGYINSAPIVTENLARFPFVYAVEPGRMFLREREAIALRNYLYKGGFLMLDDFWGEEQWQNVYEQMKRLFPGREIKELPFTHPIFHCVFDMKIQPQMPAIEIFENYGITWENRWDYIGDHDSHFYGIFDDQGRLMVFIGRNNDFGDGWERENISPSYFHTFSEKQAYPMFINILFYAMTH